MSWAAVAAFVCGMAWPVFVLPFLAGGIGLVLVPPLVLLLLGPVLLVPLGLLLSCIALWRIAGSGGERRGFALALAALVSCVIGIAAIVWLFRQLSEFRI